MTSLANLADSGECSGRLAFLRDIPERRFTAATLDWPISVRADSEHRRSRLRVQQETAGRDEIGDEAINSDDGVPVAAMTAPIFCTFAERPRRAASYRSAPEDP